MSCSVEIFIRQLQDAILVPIQVVANRGGKKVLQVVRAEGEVQEREVKTGAFNATFVQIVEGLNEGEEVLLNPPLFTESAGAPGSRTQPEPKAGSTEDKQNGGTPGPPGLRDNPPRTSDSQQNRP
jgi:multidrug efflux pump subunit AcrA (membrane-fusion protein)